jgi:hypothetical protein
VPKPFLRRTLNNNRLSENLYNATSDSEFDGAIDEGNGILYASGSEFDTLSWTSVPRYTNPSIDRDIALQWQASALGLWSNYVTGCTRQEALAHTVCADVTDFNEHPWAYSLLGRRPNSVPIPDHGDNLGIFACPDPLIRDSTAQRLLFFTRKGYMGLAPYTAEPGDKVCLLKGAQFPIILRPDEDYWHLVGESYIHGIMDGEGWRETLSPQNTEQKMQTFRVK